MLTYVLDQGSQTFSAKGQLANISSFEGHMVSVATIQFCCGKKVITNNT